MKKLLRLTLALFLFLPAIHLAAETAPDFALIDHEGRFHKLSRYADQRAVVIYMHSSSCSSSKNSLPTLLALHEQFKDRSVQFLMLVADASETRDSLAARAQQQNVHMPVLHDESQLVTEALGFTVTPEVLVIDPRRMTVMHRGAIDVPDKTLHTAEMLRSRAADSYLGQLLAAMVTERPFLADGPAAEGTPLKLDRYADIREREISYAEEVAPILEERCASCHREQGVAPWAMSSHRMVQGWSAMIRETLLTRRMPPGQIDPKDVDRFADLHHIPDAEMVTLMRWIEAGAANNDDRDPLLLIEPQRSEWQLGEPDLIVEFPEQRIPATGVIDYIFTPVDIGLDEDKWVAAYEFKIGDKQALHHVVAYTQDRRQQRQNAGRGGSRTNFGGYAPGRDYVVFDEDTGVLLQRDMRFMIQFHYTTVGREVVDRTRIGLYFRDSPPQRSLARTALMNGEFVIPPGASDYPVTATVTIQEDSYLYSFGPHMHYRGKHIKFTALYPDGNSEELLSVPNFQHNWQMIYRLNEPAFLPAGTVIVADGGFDNSELNPLNPDPTQEVRWGDQVWDEMFIAWMRLSSAN